MFNYIKVSFPETSLEPQYVYSASIYQARYEHEIAVLKFRDWGVQYDDVVPGSAVMMTIIGTKDVRNFYGHVHHITPNRSPGKSFTEVTVISPSFAMKNQSQAVYKDMTADAVIVQKAKEHGFACMAIPHLRVFPQISQAGYTDWEFMVRLAKQCGYSLRTQNTELYFQPMLHDYTNYRAEAPTFEMRPEYDPAGSSLYSFRPNIGESIEYEDAFKAAVAVGGVSVDAALVSVTQQTRNNKTRTKQKLEYFDRFDTLAVVTDPEVAGYEAAAAENRNAFPYRGMAEVLGEPNLRPDMPVYLDGLGGDYNGYWTILSVEHRIIEEERNNQKYTCIIEVGADSLGESAIWEDGSLVAKPVAKPTRTIIPNVRQTNVSPKSALIVSPGPKAKATGDFGKIKNRQKPPAQKKAAPAKWKTATPQLSSATKVKSKPAAIINRVSKKTNGFK